MKAYMVDELVKAAQELRDALDDREKCAADVERLDQEREKADEALGMAGLRAHKAQLHLIKVVTKEPK